MRHVVSKTLASGIAITCAMAATPSFAQPAEQRSLAPAAEQDTAAASTARAGSPQAQEADSATITVTATRHEAKLRDVPMSVSAVGSKKLEQIGARDTQDYIASIPGVSFVDYGTGHQTFTIRGIPPLGSGATTGIYLDETPLPIDLRLFDVDRVEVLRGPQGTLYGVSSMGGAIRTITRKPNATRTEVRFRGSLNSVGHGGIGGDANAAVNLPLVTGQLALRGVFYHEREAGFVDNYSTDRTPGAPGQPTAGPTNAIARLSKDRGAHDTDGARVALRYDPGDNFNLTLTYLQQRDGYNGIGSEDEDLGRGRLRQGRLFDERFSTNARLWNLTGELKLPFATLMSSTSLARARIRQAIDVSYVFGITLGADPLEAHPNRLTNDDSDRTLTEELRLTSGTRGRFNWVLGGFYTRERLKGAQHLIVPGAEAVLGGLTPKDSFFDFFPHQGSGESAVYGEGTYHLTKELGVVAGVRHYRISSFFNDIQQGLANGGVVTHDQGKAAETGNTWKLGINYHPSPSLLLYANASSGYRPGGPNQAVPPGGTPAIPKQYRSDKLWDYELGWRADALDHRVTVNGALYYIDWTDIQITLNDNRGFQGIFNAGKARSEGAELEVELKPFTGFEVTSALSYTDAKLKTAFAAYRAGDRIPNVPKFSSNVNARYTRGLSALWNGYVQGTLTYVGNRDFYQLAPTAADPNARIHVVVPSYSKFDARIGATSGDYDVALFVQNLFDTRGQIGRDSLYGYWRTQYIAPRTVGISVKADF